MPYNAPLGLKDSPFVDSLDSVPPPRLLTLSIVHTGEIPLAEHGPDRIVHLEVHLDAVGLEGIEPGVVLVLWRQEIEGV